MRKRRCWYTWFVTSLVPLGLLTLISCAGQISEDPVALSPVESVCPRPDQETVVQAVDSDFGRTVVAEITSRAFYPAEALKAHQQGHAILCARYLQSGKLDRVLVRQSSGYPMLDGAALYATGLYTTTAPRPGQTAISSNFIHLRDLPPPPADLLAGRNAVWIDIPVSFETPDTVQPAAATDAPVPSLAKTRHPSDYSHEEAAQNPDDQRAQLHAFAVRTSERFQQHIFYPPVASIISISGSAKLMFVIRDQHFEYAWLRTSSGSPLFDGVVLLTLGYTMLDPQQLTEMHQLPAPDRPLVFELPVNFKMKQ